tara:strand:- start:618 stop:848 length:231 start_codon:yes stop_codon:yes gene_type:complete
MNNYLIEQKEINEKEIKELMREYYNKALGESIDYRQEEPEEYKSKDIIVIFNEYLETAETTNHTKALYRLKHNLKG